MDKWRGQKGGSLSGDLAEYCYAQIFKLTVSLHINVGLERVGGTKMYLQTSSFLVMLLN